jgi:hypothetical protein
MPRYRWPKGHSFSTGELNNASKLSEWNVRDIRRAYAAGWVTTEELGREYGVTPSCIVKVINRITWRNVA